MITDVGLLYAPRAAAGRRGVIPRWLALGSAVSSSSSPETRSGSARPDGLKARVNPSPDLSTPLQHFQIRPQHTAGLRQIIPGSFNQLHPSWARDRS